MVPACKPKLAPAKDIADAIAAESCIKIESYTETESCIEMESYIKTLRIDPVYS
jgi:hypothetical protein